MAYEQFSDYRSDTQEARDAAQEAWDAKQEKQKKYDDNRAPGEWLMTKSVYRMGARGCAFLAELEAEWFTLTAQNKKQWRLIDEWSSTTFTAMQLDLGMVLRVLKMKDYGIGKKHYTYEVWWRKTLDGNTQEWSWRRGPTAVGCAAGRDPPTTPNEQKSGYEQDKNGTCSKAPSKCYERFRALCISSCRCRSFGQAGGVVSEPQIPGAAGSGGV